MALPLFLIKFMVYLLMTSMFSIFTLAIKFDCLFLIIFQSFHVFVSFIFDKLAPSKIYVSKDALNHFLVHSTSKNSLRSAKKWYFSYFVFWSTGQWGGCSLAAPLALLLTERVPFSEKHHVRTNDFDDHKIGLVIHREYH